MANSTVAVIGCGLVGPLLALMLHCRGYKVTVYEKKRDPRLVSQGLSSFNLALSERGLHALGTVGLRERVSDSANSVKVYSRLIHNNNGTTSTWKYGDGPEECLYSIERARLNCILLNEAGRRGIEVCFRHKLISCNAETGDLVFETNHHSNQTTRTKVDFVCGCDGAYSVVRTRAMQLNKRSQLNFTQHYIPEGYREIHVPAIPEGGGHALDKNHLHLWPRDSFMLMALPNADGSITMTLFMATKEFDKLSQPSDVVSFFNTHFSDVIDIIGGPDKLVEEYFRTQTGPLVSIKCQPHNYKRVLLLGDAAHAMTPFYGQGVNAGFEDCTVFTDCLDSSAGDLMIAGDMYSLVHCKDSHAIVDLSLYNHEEMRRLMNSSMFWLLSVVKRYLHRVFPSMFAPLYPMIAFSRIDHHKVDRVRVQQTRIVCGMGAALILCVAVILVAGCY